MADIKAIPFVYLVNFLFMCVLPAMFAFANNLKIPTANIHFCIICTNLIVVGDIESTGAKVARET